MNMSSAVLLGIVVAAFGYFGYVHAQLDTPGALRLPRDASYFIAAPRRIRPNQLYQISVSILSLYHDELDVRAIVRGEDQEIAQANFLFTTPGTTMLQMLIPESTSYGYRNYTLKIVGAVNGGVGSYIFQNETELEFDPKQSSVFIQTNKPFYKQGQKVLFRVMPVRPNLMSQSGSMDIYIVDSTNTIVRRWLSSQTNAGGVLEMQFQLSDQPDYGVWKIMVKAFGDWYEKEFEVHEYYVPAIDVNVSAPLYISEDEFGLAGIITGNLSLGQPVRGNISMRLEVRPPLTEQKPDDPPYPSLETSTKFFGGVTDFLFTMDDLRKLVGGGSLADKELYIEARVADWFWNQEAVGHAITAVCSNRTDLVLLGDKIRTFKPNQTMNIYYAVVNKDGTPLDRDRRQITLSGTEETTRGTKTIDERMLVRDDGLALFQYKPDPEGTFIKLTAFYDNNQQSSVEMRATRHYSPTQSYIYLTTSTEKPMVNQYMVFTVTTNVWVDKVYYLITAGGNIITGDVLMMSAKQKTFSITLSRDMIPEAHIIVWQIHNDEVVSDSMNFFVNGTWINNVTLTFNRGKDFTGDIVEVNAFAEPSSYVGFNGIDYQLWKYGWPHFITETEIINELRTYDVGANTSFTHKWMLPDEQEQLVHFPAPSYGVDANTTFVYAGLLVFTDTNVTRIEHNCNETLGDHPCMDGSCYNVNQRCDGVLQCPDGQDEMGCVQDAFRLDRDKFTPARHRLGLVRRHYLQTADWMWGGHFVMPYGRLDLQTKVPDEPMAWVMGAFGISRDLGFGVVHWPVRHEATRPFYLRLEAPSYVVKGEQIGIRVTLFNYWQQNLECLTRLHGSTDYKFIVVEDYGIVSSYNPRLISGDIQTMIYLGMGQVFEIQFPVLITIDGCVNVTISAEAIIYRDTEYVTICNKYDGVTNYLNTPYFIDLISSGSMTLPDLEVPVPERFIKPEERQHLYVPGSPECYVGIVGDVMGPGLFDPDMTAETLLNKPYGSAEQNMFNFAYKLYNLKYLKATNQVRDEVEKFGLERINIDLQRQMSYMNEDGSFSMFRDYQEYTPSTWVTAFALRTLNDANDKDWELIMFIPSSLLKKIAGWLCQQNNVYSGAFVEHSPLYDRKMWPKNFTQIKIGDKTFDVPANYSLTAYVLISLKKAEIAIGNVPNCDEAMKAAQTYLEKALPGIKDVYTFAIVTYALHLTGSAESSKAFYMLEDMQRQSPYVYWADKEIPPNDIRVVDTYPYYQPRRWYDNEAYGVEATSYAMMTYLLTNRFTEATPIMKWLQTMRNTFAGQASTQDSVAALQALYEYAKLDTNNLYNIRVEVTATSMGNATARIELNSKNWPDLQKIKIHPVWGSVRGTAQGTGVAIMQLGTKVNVEYPHLIKPVAEEKYFDVYVDEWRFYGRNFSVINLRPCARWSRPDISRRSGLVALEVHIPTGYIVTNDVLRRYAQSGVVPTLRRAERYDRKVVFYFDYLESSNTTCVDLRIDRWFPVANMTIQHKLRVFDYYEPGMHNTTLYNTWSLFNLHICQVCGSFQCPYCPYYNGASAVQIPVIIGLLSFIISMSIKNIIWISQ